MIWPTNPVFDPTWPMFELVWDIIEENILTKFHVYRIENEASKAYTIFFLRFDLVT